MTQPPEPDEKIWTDKYSGYKCKIIRHAELGHLCGYVQIPKTHIYAGGYDETEEDFILHVHGGITYQGPLQQEGKAAIWLGFDCGHYLDKAPEWFTSERIKKINSLYNGENTTYRTMEYVVNECAELAKQLKDIKKIKMHKLLKGNSHDYL